MSVNELDPCVATPVQPLIAANNDFDVNDLQRTKILIKPRCKEYAKKLKISPTHTSRRTVGSIFRQLSVDTDLPPEKITSPSPEPNTQRDTDLPPNTPTSPRFHRKHPNCKVIEGGVVKRPSIPSSHLSPSDKFSSTFKVVDPLAEKLASVVPQSAPKNEGPYFCGCSDPENCGRCSFIRLCKQFVFWTHRHKINVLVNPVGPSKMVDIFEV